MLRYPCLVLDHDDTTVDSTRTVNYPQFCEAMARFRPGFSMSLEDYMLSCFHMGFYEMCLQLLHYTDRELEDHLAMWKDYHKTHHPAFFPGMPEIIRQQKAQGGYVCVVSHSTDDVILSAYDHAGVPRPDLILGAELPPEHCKPNPWPLEEIMRRYGLQPKDLLMVDDMVLGQTMASAAGVSFAAAGWCGMLPEIKAVMEEKSDFFFSSVPDFAAFLFERPKEAE